MSSLRHPRICQVIESYYTRGTDELIMILEYCPCKFLVHLTDNLLFWADGDLNGQIAYWKAINKPMP